MKSDRLLSILLLLQTRGRVPAAELAERLEVSPRTIYRDVEALSAAGVPVYAERGRHGGIALLPGFRTDVTGLTTDESRALFVLAARGAHAALGLDEALGSALRKVMAALPAPHRPAAELTSRRILVDPDRWMARPRPAVDLDTLHTAVFADRRLRIRYRHSGEPRPRTYTVDPYGLVAKAGTWYLVADRRGRPRLFRADRVSAATVTDAPVRRREGVELADAWRELRREVEERPTPLRVRARVLRSRLDLFVRLLGPTLAAPPEPEPTSEEPPEPDQTPEEPTPEEPQEGRTADEEGSWVTVELAFGELGGVRQLLQFAASVEVLSPPEARQELARATAALSDLYARELTCPQPPPPSGTAPLPVSSAGLHPVPRPATD
ncbi:WYL domain-containing protein [Streptomyces sp. MST-110588]|uniref:helix-turn-helix transcriptional regulator n=1 Tax=Streptomyces sp. MST-110588 TaxID=2833628 RepID=UPI001F5D9081|nr:WYL domain-containing protein [Streptomyces sp. MST-110588]UNO40395.1 WYL domain-containing protein [Streptomyces sp. MST-110588]